jgi:hypothetical protein
MKRRIHQPSEATLCGLGGSPGLNEDVEHDTILTAQPAGAQHLEGCG